MFSWTWDLRRALDRKERQRHADAVRLVQERREVSAFCAQVLGPALEDIKGELEQLGRTVTIHRTDTTYHLVVRNGRAVEFDYSMKACRKRRRRWFYDYASAVAVEYASAVDKTYDLRDIRRTTRAKVAAFVIGCYRQRLGIL